MSMKATYSRGTRGFTVVEMLTTLAILVVVMAVAIANIFAVQKNMEQTELDNAARQVYIVAQNHLTYADSQGQLQQYKNEDGKLGVQDDESKGVYRFVYGNGATGVNSPVGDGANSVLGLMLPYGSIDDALRLDGSYVIRYDKASARVVDVFYCRQEPRGTSFTNEDVTAETDGLFTYEGAGSEAGRKRQDYHGRVIGYCDGTTVSGERRTDLQPPVVQVSNGDKLVVMVKDGNRINPTGNGYALTLTVQGEKSGKMRSFELASQDRIQFTPVLSALSVTSEQTPFMYEKELDNILGTRAATLLSTFIPGENIEIWAQVSYRDRLANIARSARITTNSLFGYMREAAGESEGVPATPAVNEVGITSIRHLENLDSAVSRFNAAQLNVKDAYQLRDLDWNEFVGNVEGAGEGALSERSARTWNIAPAASGESPVIENGTFKPVDLQGIAYHGTGSSTGSSTGAVHRISNVDIKATGDAGLFGGLADESSVSDLELVDFSVVSTAGNAGALAGSVSAGATVSGVLVRDSGPRFESAVVGAASAGGLAGSVGSASGTMKCEIAGCAAAVIVSSTGQESAAGGLVGRVAGETAIVDSYSGGHTTGGAYGAENFNVSGGAAAGGLVGEAVAGLDVQRCYSTCSAQAETAGGLVGEASGSAASAAKIANCYATGLVSGQAGAGAGAVVGSLGAGAELQDVHYFGIVNRGMGAVGSGSASGNGSTEGAQPFDADLSSYSQFVSGGADATEAPAVPYDSDLAKYYRGSYPLRTISRLGGFGDAGEGATVPIQATVHYGDWPAPEQWVIN